MAVHDVIVVYDSDEDDRSIVAHSLAHDRIGMGESLDEAVDDLQGALHLRLDTAMASADVWDLVESLRKGMVALGYSVPGQAKSPSKKEEEITQAATADAADPPPCRARGPDCFCAACVTARVDANRAAFRALAEGLRKRRPRAFESLRAERYACYCAACVQAREDAGRYTALGLG